MSGCPHTHRPGRKTCAPCGQKASQRGKARCLRLKKTGLCVKCGKQPSVVGRGNRCNACADKHKGWRTAPRRVTAPKKKAEEKAPVRWSFALERARRARVYWEEVYSRAGRRN